MKETPCKESVFENKHKTYVSSTYNKKLDWRRQRYEAGMDVSTARFDCGFPIDPVAKLADPDLKDDMPEVYEFLTNVTMTNAQQEEMVLAKVEGGLTDDEVAREWMDANESVWEAWIP